MLATRTKLTGARLISRLILALRRILGQGPEVVVVRRGLRWHLDLCEGIDLAMYLFGSFEAGTVRAYDALVAPGDLVLDIGANVGAHTLQLARRVAPTGRVLAFEPTDFAFAKLQRNLAANPQLGDLVLLRQTLLTDAKDAESLASPVSSPEPAVYSSWPLDRGRADDHPLHGGRPMTTHGARLASLDSELEQFDIGRVALIKLDTDGSETAILRGAARALERFGPPILMELAPHVFDEVNPESFQELLDLLTGAGYAIFKLGSRLALDPDAAALRRRIPHGCSLNVLARRTAVRGSLATDIGSRSADSIAARHLHEQARFWTLKPALRRVYQDFHRRLLKAVPAGGSLLEIGTGSGHLREHLVDSSRLVSLDLVPTRHVDVSADAHRLPFRDASFDGLVMLDTLHHLQQPLRFLGEVARVLRPGGRLAMIEPAVTPLSGLFYRAFHDEPVDCDADPWSPQPKDLQWRAFDANQAVPTLLFRGTETDRRLAEHVPTLRICNRSWLSLWAYPLSGGFRPWSLLPSALVRPLLRTEEALLPWLGPLAAFRLFVVLEKRAMGRGTEHPGTAGSPGVG